MITALLRFHLQVGARLALRVMAPLLAAVVGGMMLLGVDFINSFGLLLFGSSGGLIIAFACLGVASIAAPRVCRGLDGWMRHLPVTGLAHRRAAMIAIAAAQASLLLLLLFFAAAAAKNGADPWPSLAGLLVALPAAALAAMPVRFLARPLALTAACIPFFGPFSGGWLPVGLGAVLLIASDAIAGPLRKTPPAISFARRGTGNWLEARIAWRALGGSLLGAYLTSLLPLGAAMLFVRNNELAPVYVRLGAVLGGCTGEQFQKGYILPPGALEQIPIGASQDQVLIVMGTPSTVATLNGEVFYYISQRSERKIAFMNQQVVDQRVIAIYFDKKRQVQRLANYGLQDGKIFDFISRTTPTSGQELSYLTPLFKLMSFN